MLSNEEKQKVIKKYKKLLAMTHSPIAAEADTATKMAEKYRIDHNIKEIVKIEILNSNTRKGPPSPVSWFDNNGIKHWMGEDNWTPYTPEQEYENQSKYWEPIIDPNDELKKEQKEMFDALWTLMKEKIPTN
jgi:hypothetical protein